MKKQILSIIYLASAVCALISVGGCERRKETTEPEIIPVKVMKVELRDIQNTLNYVGNIKAQDEALIYPKVSGKIIEKLKEEGSQVKKGDVIAYIDRDVVGFKFEKAAVESPLTGIIGRVHVDRGTQVSPQTPIALVVDMDKVEINLDIPEKYLPKIALGQSAKIRVDAYPALEFKGIVSWISPVVDLPTRTAPIEIVIDNPDHRLKSGMFARVGLIIGEKRNVPVILKEAILGLTSKPYVYTVEKGKAHKRYITLGLRRGADFEVTEGLQGGDLVVVMGQQRLHDHAPVMVEKE